MSRSYIEIKDYYRTKIKGFVISEKDIDEREYLLNEILDGLSNGYVLQRVEVGSVEWADQNYYIMQSCPSMGMSGSSLSELVRRQIPFKYRGGNIVLYKLYLINENLQKMVDYCITQPYNCLEKGKTFVGLKYNKDSDTLEFVKCFNK
jgi:hypothetical protein